LSAEKEEKFYIQLTKPVGIAFESRNTDHHFLTVEYLLTPFTIFC